MTDNKKVEVTRSLILIISAILGAVVTFIGLSDSYYKLKSKYETQVQSNHAMNLRMEKSIEDMHIQLRDDIRSLNITVSTRFDKITDKTNKLDVTTQQNSVIIKYLQEQIRGK